MAKTRTVFTCNECGYETSRWLGRCPTCGRYNTLEESVVSTAPAAARAPLSGGFVPAGGSVPALLKDVSSRIDTGGRTETGVPELDRVLGGGVVAGSLMLLGGEPGIGKSTLLLQLCGGMGRAGRKILYVTGEESAGQVKLRAERLKTDGDGVYLLAETDIQAIRAAVEKVKPVLLLVDSIQTMRHGDLTSLPGSVTQVRECTAVFGQMAKAADMAVILVGHVTKEGAIAGPRVLEHMVDTVLYFEGERQNNFRVIRAYKNRFGATDELGIFEMREEGLCGIADPSAHMLAGRPLGVSGTAVTCSMEGTRPLLMEVQGLVSYTNFGTPRRTANGMDYNRVVMLMAVLEKRAGYKLATYDSYVNVAGGLRVDEPAADAGVLAALASCYKNKPIDPLTAVMGEVGLAGEMRAVHMADKRVSEAARHGFTSCVLPQANLKRVKKPDGMRVYGAANVGELLGLLI